MYAHLHLTRRLMAWGLGVLAIVPTVVFTAASSPTQSLSEVKGRVTYSGRPLNDMTICLDTKGGAHYAYAPLRSDGSFYLINMTRGYPGALPGRYHAHLYTHAHGPTIPAKYHDSAASGIEIEVASDWNDFHIDLP